MSAEKFSEDHAERMWDYLRDSDAPAADASAALERAQKECKQARARAYLVANGTIDERKSIAELDPEVQAADDRLIAATLKDREFRNRRETAKEGIGLCRTFAANRRQG